MMELRYEVIKNWDSSGVSYTILIKVEFPWLQFTAEPSAS